MTKVVVLTGAGVSAESGLSTFRDSGGLWEGFNIEEVATINGWLQNREKVLDFYNKRRAQASNVNPNKAHYSIVELEEKFDVTVITQNVDDLHERAGSADVIHLHGMLRQARSEKDENLVTDVGAEPILLGDKATDGSQLRPNVVWFGEAVPMIETAADLVAEADIFIVIGTSLVVYPAAGLVDFTKPGTLKYIVDPSVPELYSFKNWTHIKETAVKGMPSLTEKLLNE